MSSVQSELASQWITLLAAGMLVIQLLMVVQGMVINRLAGIDYPTWAPKLS